MSDKSKGKITDWAILRFSIIGGLLARPPRRGELQKKLEELSGHTYPHPSEDKSMSFGVSTIVLVFLDESSAGTTRRSHLMIPSRL